MYNDKILLQMIKEKVFIYDKKQRPYYHVPTTTRRNGQMLVPKSKLLQLAKENNLNLEDYIRPY